MSSYFLPELTSYFYLSMSQWLWEPVLLLRFDKGFFHLETEKWPVVQRDCEIAYGSLSSMITTTCMVCFIFHTILLLCSQVNFSSDYSHLDHNFVSRFRLVPENLESQGISLTARQTWRKRSKKIFIIFIVFVSTVVYTDTVHARAGSGCSGL